MPKKLTYSLATEDMLKPLPPQKTTDRRAWGIPVIGVWVPYFTAMKVAIGLDISDEALGAPVRQQFEKDGSPKFSEKGTPRLGFVREFNEHVKTTQGNFVRKLLADTQNVQQVNPEGYRQQVVRSYQAGEVVLNADAQRVMAFIEKQKRIQADLDALHAVQDDHTQPAPEPIPELVAA